MICAGIDGGSRAIKVVLLDAADGRVLAQGSCDQGVDGDALANELFAEVLRIGGLERGQVGRIVATGYGRNRISLADSTVTEITCHARGVRRQVPEAMSIIEIGGQDSKVLRLDGNGTVRDFAMNDRCAAGTGRFLEVVVSRLGGTLSQAGELASRSVRPEPISSTCVVFAETEIIGLLAGGSAPADIVAGVQAAIAARISAMAGPRLEGPVVFTGGVALVGGMAEALASAVGQAVRIAPDPLYTGALGAAILAAQQAGGC